MIIFINMDEQIHDLQNSKKQSDYEVYFPKK